MKKINKIQLNLLLAFTILFNANFLYAQDLTTQSMQPQIQDVEGLRAEFKESTQDPATKKIKYEMILKSNVDSDRVRIVWTTSGSNILEPQAGYEITGNTARGDLSIKKGQTYSIPIVVTVTGEGVNELFGRAEAFLAQSTYIATVRKNYATNKNAEVLPLTDAYKQASTINSIVTVVIIVIGVIAIFAILYYALKLFLKWLDKDERQL